MPEESNDKTANPSHDDGDSPRASNAFGCGAFVDFDQEIARLQTDASFKEQAGRKSKMLVRFPEFRMVLVTMRAGSKWEDHKTNVRICVQPLHGHIRFRTADRTVDMRVGQLLTLDPDTVHSVDSPEESAFLLTLSSAKQQ